MADSNILIQLEVVQKGNKLSVVAKDTEKLSKSTDRATASSQKLEKQSGKTYGRFQQGAIGTANATKSFSKLNQTIGGGGSGGAGALVGAYAVLAANIFAVTAAFNAFRGAAGVDKLTEGLEAFSNTTGQSLDLVAKRLQETTGNAVSFEQAMRTAALSTSAGFGTTEMEGLTRVAKGASLALGRDMGDALDRLTRGAIKLEPEILDELGIMVRLDDATEAYAATLGKTAGSLTRFERQQAFMNAIISEGEDKFGAIADEIDPNVYDQLSAAFADLSQSTLSFLNGALEPLIGFLIKVPQLFLGAVAIFSGGIIKRMIPAFGDMAQSAKNSAEAARVAIEESIQAGVGQNQALREQIKVNKEGLPAFDRLVGKIKQGTATSKELTTAQRSLGQRLSKLTKQQDEYTAANGRANAQLSRRIKILQDTKAQLQQLQATEVSTQAQRAFGIAKANEAFAERNIGLIAEAQRQTFGYQDKLKQLKTIFKGISASAKQYFLDLVEVNTAQNAGGKGALFFRNALAFLKTGFKTAGVAARTFGVILLNSIPIIGQIIFIGGILIEVFKKIAQGFGFFSEESKAAKEAQKDFQTVLDGVPDKMEQITKLQERTTASSMTMTKTYKILGGLVKSIADEATTTQQKLDAANDGVSDLVFGEARQVGGRGAGAEQAQDRENKKVEARNLKAFKSASAYAQGLSKLEEQSETAAKVIQNELGMSVDDFITKAILAGESAESIGAEMESALLRTETALNGLSGSTEALVTNLREAEKAAGKFIRKTAESTQYDALVQEFEGATNKIFSIQKEAEQAGVDASIFIGEAIGALGKNMTLLAGVDVVKASSQLTDLQTKLAQQQVKLRQASLVDRFKIRAEIEKTRKDIIKAQENLADIAAKEIPIAAKQLAIAQAIEITQKSQLKSINERVKANRAVLKNSLMVAAAANLENIAIDKQLLLLRQELKIREGQIQAAKDKAEANKVLTKDEQAALSFEEAKLREIQTLESTRASQALIDAEIAKQTALDKQARLNAEIELNKVLVERMQLEKDIGALRRQLFGIDEERAKGAVAKQEMDIALQQIAFAKEQAQLKFAVIQAEHALLAARAETEKAINNNRIAELDKELNDRTKIEQQIAEIRANPKGQFNRRTRERGLSGAQQERVNQLEIQAEGLIGAEAAETTKSAFAATNDALTKGVTQSAELVDLQGKILGKTLDNIELKAEKAKLTFITNLGDNLLTQVDGGGTAFSAIIQGFEGIKDLSGQTAEEVGSNFATALGTLGQVFQSTFGEDGIILSSFTAFAGSLGEGLGTLITKINDLKGRTLLAEDDENFLTQTQAQTLQIAQGFEFASGALQGLMAMQQARSQAAIKDIDSQIAAEKKRDGKSTESIKKIEALEKKKELLKRKAFEQEKKMNIAQTVMNTAVGIMKGIAQGGILGFATAGIIAAMGAAQLSMIKSQQYEGGGATETAAAAPTTNIAMGSRTNEVDVSARANRGELAYLRGDAGRGTVSNFTPAASGRKGYAMGSDGVVVGERGPEVISPSIPVDITPNDQIGRATTNVSFTIHAVDAAGLEQTIQSQRGNIISMIRDAANGYGEEFLEQVDVDTLDNGISPVTGGSY